jgi:hypothetical protein
MDSHRPSRDIMARLEKGLRDALQLNEVRSRHPIDEPRFAEVIVAFAKRCTDLALH